MSQPIIISTPSYLIPSMRLDIPIEVKSHNGIPILNGFFTTGLSKSRFPQSKESQLIHEYYYKISLIYHYQHPIYNDHCQCPIEFYNHHHHTNNNHMKWRSDENGKILYRLLINSSNLKSFCFESTELIPDLINIIEKYSHRIGIYDEQFCLYSYNLAAVPQGHFKSFIENELFQGFLQYYLYQQLNEIFEFYRIQPDHGELIRILPDYGGIQLKSVEQQMYHENVKEFEILTIGLINGISFDQNHNILNISELLNSINNRDNSGYWNSGEMIIKSNKSIRNNSIPYRNTEYNGILILLLRNDYNIQLSVIHRY